MRLARSGQGRHLWVELIRGDRVGACNVAGHWELVAQQLAGALLCGSLPGTGRSGAGVELDEAGAGRGT